MRHIATRFVGAVLAALTASAGAMAQSYYDDQACRQFADAQIAPLRDQANSQAMGALSLEQVSGQRSVQPSEAAAAPASERHEVPGVGAANAQNAAGYLQQQYNGYYAQCMASRRYPPPQYGRPAPAYAPAPGYSPTPSYGPPPGYSTAQPATT